VSGITLALIIVFSVLAALGIGTVVGVFYRRILGGRRLTEAEAQAVRIQGEAEQQKKAALLEAKEEALRLRSGAEQDLRQQRSDLQRQERRLTQREENLDRRADSLENRQNGLSNREQRLEATQAELESLKERQLKDLEAIAELTLQEAKEAILKKAEIDSQHELARRYYDLDARYRDEADEKARKYIALSIQRLASDVVTESTVTSVSLPNDEMKGRLIGREGRNIRAIEQATGVDLIIDDTPEAVTISCFDPIRREVARVALEQLIKDGRIHPARVETAVERAQTEVDQVIKDAGEQAIFDAGVRGLHPDLVKLLGRLKYRTSYGGNVLQHSVEASLIAGMLASEVGVDIQVCKAGALLHDIGKALTHEVEGPHAEIGADVAVKNKVRRHVCDTIREHHDDVHSSAESFIVAAADAISAARPGARRDTVEHYVKRLEALEEVARAFDGVEKCYAIQAGREVRILVEPESVDDLAANKMAREIVKQIEAQLAYPGQIKVTVIRESRSVEFAR
jgi:ribonuclease Y